MVIKVSQSLIYKSFEGLGGESSSIHKRNGRGGEEFYTRKGAITQVVCSKT